MRLGISRKLFLAAAAAVFSGCTPQSPYYRQSYTPAEVPARKEPVTIAVPAEEETPEAAVKEKVPLRVLLRRGNAGLKISAAGGLKLTDRAGTKTLAKLPSREKAKISTRDGCLIVDGEKVSSQDVEVLPLDEKDVLRVAGRIYRGRIFLKISRDGELLLVNEVPLNHYVCGVLASEVPAEWPMEALKAQAVAARTYAVLRLAQSSTSDYDLDDTTRSQVYCGTEKETSRTNEAAGGTGDLVLAFDGKPAECFYHSNCGGHTADASKVWGSKVPYLRGVADPFCEGQKHFTWKETITITEIEDALRKDRLLEGEIQSLWGEDKDASGRWENMVLKTEEGQKKVRSSAFRLAVGADKVRSTRFELVKTGGLAEFQGKGWGHGIGMCQEGARGMADKDYSFRKILEFYFPETRVRSLKEFPQYENLAF